MTGNPHRGWLHRVVGKANIEKKSGLVAHSVNPHYSGSRDRLTSSEPAWVTQQDFVSKEIKVNKWENLKSNYIWRCQSV